MPAQVEVDLGNGNKIYFGGGVTQHGLREASVGNKVAKVTREKFEGALASLANVIESLESSLSKVAKKPDTVELEFGASLTADCDLWVVSGEGTAEFKVTLKWGK